MKSRFQKWIDSIIAFAILAFATLTIFQYSFMVGLFFSAICVFYGIFVLLRTPGGRFHLFRYRTSAISTVLPNILKSIDAEHCSWKRPNCFH